MGRIWHTLAPVILVTLALLGCASDGSSSPTPVERESTLPSPLAPTPQPTLPPTATPDPCPPIRESALPARPATFGNEYVLALQEYLNAGGDPATLAQVLQEWEALAPEGGLPLRQDLTGDGSPEIVVTCINPQAETFPPEGLLAVLICRNGAYETLYTYMPEPFSNIALIGGQDLTGDGKNELVFAEVTCGAHTCWDTLHVGSWNGSDFQEQISGEAALPYPTFTLTQDAILARSVGMGSVGAGPQRVYTETWAWNGSVITRTATELGPARYRYHVFRDGDAAFRAGHYAEAFDAYLRVINDETLEPWAGFYSAPEERLWFTALARWRLLLLGMQLGNTPDAEAHYQRLQADFTPETPGYPVAQLARRFWDAYARLGMMPGACEEALAAPEAPVVLEFLNSFGYANPTYTAEELCPLMTP